MDKIGASKKIIEETKCLYASLIAEPLSERQLARPPFKFIQNLVKSVSIVETSLSIQQPRLINKQLLNETRILRDEFNQTDFDPKKQWDKRAKAQFVQKLIDFAANNKLPVIGCVASKVVAGLEPNKTNELLQSLARVALRKLARGQDSRRPQTFTKRPISSQLSSGSPASSAGSTVRKLAADQERPATPLEAEPQADKLDEAKSDAKEQSVNQWDLVRGINQVRVNLRSLQRSVKEAAKIEELLRESLLAQKV